MKSVLISFLLWGIMINNLQGQERNFWQQMGDSIKYYKENQKPALLIGFDNRSTFIGNRGIRLNGLKIGANYTKFSIFLGLYGTNKDLVFERLINQSKQIPDTLLQITGFNYLSLGFTYNNWASKNWYFETTGQFGLGNGRERIYENSTFIKERNIPIFPLEINGKAYYMFTKWIGLGAGLGARKSLFSGSQFDGIYYTAGIKFYIGRFYKQVIRGK